MSQAAVSPPDVGPVVDACEPEPTLVSVSTTFFPGAGLEPLPEDLVIISSDSVFFYVHSHKLLASSHSGFDGILRQHIKRDRSGLDPDQVLSLHEHSAVLNVLLHTLYSMSVSHYSPTHENIADAASAMARYGIPLKVYIAPSTPLFSLILANAAHSPLEMYAIAASFDLYELAASISVHLLSLPLYSVTDEMAARIGPVYLKRLVFLHLGRIDALKRLLVSPPNPHEPTYECDSSDQKRVTRAWALASAYLAWDARPGKTPVLSVFVNVLLVLTQMPCRSVDWVHTKCTVTLGGSPHLRALQTPPAGTYQ